MIEEKFMWAWPDVVPEDRTGEWMRFLASRASPILMEHLGLYTKYSVSMCLHMVFGFNKDALCRILNVPLSKERVSEIAKNLLVGRFQRGLEQMARIRFIEWIGLAWSGLYAMLAPPLAFVGLCAMAKSRQYSYLALFLLTLGILVVLAAFGVSLNYQVTRYAMPAKPFLILSAVIGARMTTDWVRTRQSCLDDRGPIPSASA